jgi:hypothetical protein
MKLLDKTQTDFKFEKWVPQAARDAFNEIQTAKPESEILLTARRLITDDRMKAVWEKFDKLEEPSKMLRSTFTITIKDETVNSSPRSWKDACIYDFFHIVPYVPSRWGIHKNSERNPSVQLKNALEQLEQSRISLNIFFKLSGYGGAISENHPIFALLDVVRREYERLNPMEFELLRILSAKGQAEELAPRFKKQNAKSAAEICTIRYLSGIFRGYFNSPCDQLVGSTAAVILGSDDISAARVRRVTKDLTGNPFFSSNE